MYEALEAILVRALERSGEAYLTYLQWTHCSMTGVVLQHSSSECRTSTGPRASPCLRPYSGTATPASCSTTFPCSSLVSGVLSPHKSFQSSWTIFTQRKTHCPILGPINSPVPAAPRPQPLFTQRDTTITRPDRDPIPQVLDFHSMLHGRSVF